VQDFVPQLGRHASKLLIGKFVQEFGVGVVIHRVFAWPGGFAHVKIIVRQIEVAEIRSGRIEIWVDRGDGSVCGPRGERLARQALYHAHPHGRACGGGLVLVIDAQDALL